VPPQKDIAVNLNSLRGKHLQRTRWSIPSETDRTRLGCRGLILIRQVRRHRFHRRQVPSHPQDDQPCLFANRKEPNLLAVECGSIPNFHHEFAGTVSATLTVPSELRDRRRHKPTHAILPDRGVCLRNLTTGQGTALNSFKQVICLHQRTRSPQIR